MLKQDVYTLLCHRDMDMASVTLPKILKFLKADQKLIIFDDDSFTTTDINWCLSLSEKVEVITFSDRNSIVSEELKNYPNCLKYRRELPLAFKLLDIPIIAKKGGNRFTFTDTDILYLKNCEHYFSRDVNTYLKTDSIKISVRLQHVFMKYKWRVPFKFNSGYFSFDLHEFDLDFLEYYLGLSDIRNTPWLSEQTAWALLFARSGNSYCPDENQFICREKFDGPSESTLAIHLIGKENKYKYENWAEPVGDVDMEAKFYKSRNVTKLDWIKKTAARLFT
ncbi:MAG TPA: hypothetical protein VGN63_01775 [Flavisolibacter sp.]|jgi:hypothetical protein|nr:hypothetical protein [Flavisolibacter sp.]